jgi:predicted Rossmann-fold nucleotide-binding protein
MKGEISILFKGGIGTWENLVLNYSWIRRKKKKLRKYSMQR